MFKLFKKGGLNGSKNVNFEEKKIRFEMGLKNIYNMCHMAPKRVFLKSQDFEFSQKRGVKKVKMKNLKKYFQN